jgi:hypothetical protein
MPIVPGRSSKLPVWITVALLLLAAFAAVHGVGGLITGTVLVPRSHGYYASAISDAKAYEWSELFWLITAGGSGLAGLALAAKPWGRKSLAVRKAE